MGILVVDVEKGGVASPPPRTTPPLPNVAPDANGPVGGLGADAKEGSWDNMDTNYFAPFFTSQGGRPQSPGSHTSGEDEE